MGFGDSNYANDLVPSMAMSILDDYDCGIQIFFANSDVTDYDQELFGTNECYLCGDDDDVPLFESDDIWEVWSMIRSNPLVWEQIGDDTIRFEKGSPLFKAEETWVPSSYDGRFTYKNYDVYFVGGQKGMVFCEKQPKHELREFYVLWESADGEKCTSSDAVAYINNGMLCENYPFMSVHYEDEVEELDVKLRLEFSKPKHISCDWCGDKIEKGKKIMSDSGDNCCDKCIDKANDSVKPKHISVELTPFEINVIEVAIQGQLDECHDLKGYLDEDDEVFNDEVISACKSIQEKVRVK